MTANYQAIKVQVQSILVYLDLICILQKNRRVILTCYFGVPLYQLTCFFLNNSLLRLMDI